MQQVDLNLLPIFLEVYQQRSITLAADVLNLTQPAVSGAIKRLQNTLGVELFVRDGRGISPTNAGIQFARQLLPAYNLVNDALNNVSGFDEQTPRSFLVYVNESIMSLLQPLVESDTSMGNCEIEFQLTPNNEEELQQQLSHQKVDLAIDIGELISPFYATQPFYQEELVAIYSANHPRLDHVLTKEQFYQEKHVVIKVRRAGLNILPYFSEDLLSTRKISCECQSMFAVMALVSESNCIGISTPLMVEKHAHKFAIQYSTLPFKMKPIQHNMIWHQRNEYHPAHIWLRNKLNGLIQQAQDDKRRE